MSWTATHSWAYKEAPSSTIFNAQLRDNMDYLKTAVENSVTVGTITMFGGAIAPTGFLLCQGQAVLRSTYAALFAIIGVAYGVGDNSTTFNLPNLQDNVPVGKSGSKALGTTGGEATHTLITGEMPAHAHSIASWLNAGGGGVVKPYIPGGGDPYGYSSNTAGSGDAHNNLQPYQVVNYIIKY